MFKPQPGVWLPVSLFAALLGLTFYQILVFNGGHFTYALDDPYIGLAMAEELLHGNYGINPGEPASAVSTILSPLVMTPLEDFVPTLPEGVRFVMFREPEAATGS